jgi:hypothetical protein
MSVIFPDSITSGQQQIQLLAHQFKVVGNELMNRSEGGSADTFERRFKAHFGTIPEICADIWLRLNPPTLLAGARIEHLLWGFILLKCYDTDDVNASRVGGVDEQTWRHWSWYFIDCVSQLEADIVSGR